MGGNRNFDISSWLHPEKFQIEEDFRRLVLGIAELKVGLAELLGILLIPKKFNQNDITNNQPEAFI